MVHDRDERVFAQQGNSFWEYSHKKESKSSLGHNVEECMFYVVAVLFLGNYATHTRSRDNERDFVLSVDGIRRALGPQGS